MTQRQINEQTEKKKRSAEDCLFVFLLCSACALFQWVLRRERERPSNRNQNRKICFSCTQTVVLWILFFLLSVCLFVFHILACGFLGTRISFVNFYGTHFFWFEVWMLRAGACVYFAATSRNVCQHNREQERERARKKTAITIIIMTIMACENVWIVDLVFAIETRLFSLLVSCDFFSYSFAQVLNGVHW